MDLIFIKFEIIQGLILLEQNQKLNNHGMDLYQINLFSFFIENNNSDFHFLIEFFLFLIGTNCFFNRLIIKHYS